MYNKFNKLNTGRCRILAVLHLPVFIIKKEKNFKNILTNWGGYYIINLADYANIKSIIIFNMSIVHSRGLKK